MIKNLILLHIKYNYFYLKILIALLCLTKPFKYLKIKLNKQPILCKLTINLRKTFTVAHFFRKYFITTYDLKDYLKNIKLIE